MRAILFSATIFVSNFAMAVESPHQNAIKLAFDELDVKFDPSLLASTGHEQIIIKSDGNCWYKAEGLEAAANVAARPAAVFGHIVPAARIERINRLLQETQWLTAKGGEGPGTHSDANTITINLIRDGKQQTVTCRGQRPEPYAALLHELEGLAAQERRIYLHDYVSGKTGIDAWLEMGRELDALRGGPYAKSPFTIDYERYLPIAKRKLRDFYGKSDDQLIPAIRLTGHFKLKSELEFLHRMAHDRSPDLRREVAWALGRIHEPESLPVLASMMSAQASSPEVGFELISWGDDAVPYIVELIRLSTDDQIEHRKNTIGENMVRAYLHHRDKIHDPIDARVVDQVQKSLQAKNPGKGSIRTTYHVQFLELVGQQSGTRER